MYIIMTTKNDDKLQRLWNQIHGLRREENKKKKEAEEIKQLIDEQLRKIKSYQSQQDQLSNTEVSVLNQKRKNVNDDEGNHKMRISPIQFQKRSNTPVSPLLNIYTRNGTLSPMPLDLKPKPLTRGLSYEKKKGNELVKPTILKNNQVIIYIAAMEYYNKEQYRKFKEAAIENWKNNAVRGENKFFSIGKNGSISVLDYFQKMIEKGTLKSKNGVSIPLNAELSKQQYGNPKGTFLDADIQHMYKVGSVYANNSNSGTDQREQTYRGVGNPTKNLLQNVYFWPFYWIIDFEPNVPLEEVTPALKRKYCCNIIENGIHEKLFEHGYMVNDYHNTNTRLRKSEAVFNLHSCDLKDYINALLSHFKDKEILLSNKTEGGGRSNYNLRIKGYELVTNCDDCCKYDDDDEAFLGVPKNNRTLMKDDDDIVLKF